MVDNLIKKYESEINAAIDTNHNYFYIQPLRSGDVKKYGVIFNGQLLASCYNFYEVENIKNTILFLLNGGLKNE